MTVEFFLWIQAKLKNIPLTEQCDLGIRTSNKSTFKEMEKIPTFVEI